MDAAERAAFFPSKIRTLRNRTPESCWACKGNGLPRLPIDTSNAAALKSPAGVVQPHMSNLHADPGERQPADAARCSYGLMPANRIESICNHREVLQISHTDAKRSVPIKLDRRMGKCTCRTRVELKLKRTIDFDPPATVDCNFLAREYDPARSTRLEPLGRRACGRL